MDGDRHSAPVVRHLQRSVGVQHHVDLLGVAGQRLVDAIIDDLVSEVIRARRVRVHPGTTANGLEPAQDFDVRSAVVVAHCPDPRSNGRIVRAPARYARDCSAFPFRIETEMLCSPRVRTYPRSSNEQATRASSEADPMDITILAYLEPGDEKPDVVMEQVATALEKSGHKTSILTIRHDVVEMVEGLKKRKPNLVFNLVESFGDDILGGAMGVAGVLDLLELPYTRG